MKNYPKRYYLEPNYDKKLKEIEQIEITELYLIAEYWQYYATQMELIRKKLILKQLGDDND